MKTIGKKNKKIIAACSVAIFSLLAVCGGVYSWFTLELNQALDSTPFVVVNTGSCNLYSMELYKFNYSVHQYGSQYIIDYSSPETGEVAKYGYSETHQAFGYDDGEWHAVSMMNIYDPVSLQLSGGSLASLNCNSIYKFTISTNDLDTVKLSASAQKIVDRIKDENEIFLTTCADFDIYYESDLLDSNPAFTDGDDHKMYYPTYIDKSDSLTDEEEVFYKISYLSSLASNHPNLYDDDGSMTEDTDVTFEYDSTLDTKILTLYVNVNYSPVQLEYTMFKIYHMNIVAICDFGFNFFFYTGVNE